MMSIRSGWIALAGLALGACAQDVDDLPVPRAWSYGTAEVAVVESPAGATVAAPRSPRLQPAPALASTRAGTPVGFVGVVEALSRSLAAIGTHDDRRAAADTSRRR